MQVTCSICGTALTATAVERATVIACPKCSQAAHVPHDGRVHSLAFDEPTVTLPGAAAMTPPSQPARRDPYATPRFNLDTVVDALQGGSTDQSSGRHETGAADEGTSGAARFGNFELLEEIVVEEGPNTLRL